MHKAGVVTKSMQKKKVPMVKLTIFFADDAYDVSILIPKNKWEEIKEGKPFKKNGEGYFGEGADGYCKWQDRWTFDKRELNVTSTALKNPNEVTEDFIGPIEEIHVEEIEGADS
ncbi:MAG TPA: hypothetical protein DCP55_07460 [Chitinophagaceae bacterium]|nr:hypothetical protein [Pseudomonadota bacterium]HAL95747.1 hypothetical protein [Chitinophagaceae bacterium]